MSTSPGSVEGDAALRDEKLDVTTGDLVLNASDGDQTMIYGMEGLASDLKCAWQEVKGEWFLDLEEGLDWWGIVLGKNRDVGSITQEFTRVALLVPGVVQLRKFIPTLVPGARELRVSYEAEGDTGLVFGEQDVVLSPGGST